MKLKDPLNNIDFLKNTFKKGFRQKLFLISLLVLSSNFFVGYTIYKSNDNLVNSQEWIEHTEDVILQSRNVLSFIKDIEIESCSLIATDNKTLVDTNLKAKKIIHAISRLEYLTLNNPAQQKRIDSLKFYVVKYLAFSYKTRTVRFSEGLQSAINFVSNQDEKRYAKNIHNITAGIQKEEARLLKERKKVSELRTVSFNRFSITVFVLMTLFTLLLLILSANYFLQYTQNSTKAKELIILNKKLSFRTREKQQRAAELIVANRELKFQNAEKENRASELNIANIELAVQNLEKEKRAGALLIANEELIYQNEEKEKRAAELVVANVELAFQNTEKEKRSYELYLANKELLFQNHEKEKRAEELIVANVELGYQNKEKKKRAAELVIANKELIFQNTEKEKRASELILANIELKFQNEEKEKRAQEVTVANIELSFQNKEKQSRSEELYIANKELLFQNKEKEKRAAELIIANIELEFQNEEKEKAAQDRLVSEGKLARAQQLAHMGSWELNFEDNVLHLSRETTRIFGFPDGTSELSYLDWTALVHPDDLAHVLSEIEKSKLDLKDSTFHHRIIRPDNTIRHIYSESKFDFDAQGISNGMFGIAQDITEAKLAEDEKEFESNNLASLINNTKDLIWSTDCDFNLITSNQAYITLARSITGRTFVRGSKVLTLKTDPEQLLRHKQYYERAFAGETFTEIEYNESPSEFWSEISYYPIRKGDEIVGTACYSRNITERKKAEKEREKMSIDIIQRSKNLEQFAYIISHNLRAPVAHILGLANVLNGVIEEKDRYRAQDYLFKAVEQMDVVIKDLHKILATKSEIFESKELVNFPNLVNDVKFGIQDLLQHENVTIVTDFSEISEIFSLKGYIQSIFYNLISNSIKYRRKDENPVIHIKSSLHEKTLKISFKDNGTGIDISKHKSSLFGLYKRFHEGIDGRGVGLFMVKTQIEALGGDVTVESEPGHGAEFIIELPLKEERV